MPKEFPDREAKINHAYQMLEAGKSGNAVNKACKAKFGSGLSHRIILKLKDELDEQRAQKGVEPSPVTQMTLPLEMLEDTPEVPQSQVMLPVPAPKGATEQFRQIRDWMSKVQAEQVILTKDGKLSVLSWHQFDLGRQDP